MATTRHQFNIGRLNIQNAGQHNAPAQTFRAGTNFTHESLSRMCRAYFLNGYGTTSTETLAVACFANDFPKLGNTHLK